jgi:O-antigen/teichoic acid export membrane protein
MLKAIFRGAGTVAVGTAAGQGIVLLITPLLARQYTPEEFGSLAILMTISNIATALACIRYDLAVPAAKKGEALSIFLVAVFAAAVSSLVAMTALGIAGFFPDLIWPSPFDNVMLVFFCIFFVGIQQAFIGLMTHERRYAGVGAVRFGQGGIFAALATIPAIGLLFAHVLSFCVAVPFAVRRMAGLRISMAEVGRSAYKNRDFPLLSLPGAVLDVLGYSACIWIMVYFYGTAEAGQYSQIQRIVGAPLMLIGMSVGQVLLRSSVDLKSKPEKLSILFSQICSIALLLGFIVILAVALIGEPLLHWILGQQWRADTAFIVPIALAVTVRACISPLSMILVTLNRFDLALRWQTTYFISSLLLLSLAAVNLEFKNFIFFYATHEFILYSLYLIFISKAIRKIKCAESSV